MSSPEPDISQITCYDSIAPPQGTVDSIKKLVPTDLEAFPVPHITCYDITVTDIETDSLEDIVMCYVPAFHELIKEVVPDLQPVMMYGSVQHPPVSPAGNLEEFSKWVQDNIVYPRIMLENKIQGRIIVNFIVDEDGNITEPKIVQNITPDADNEVLRLVTSSGKWTPGWHRGEKVKTSVLIPVKFVLPEE